jgi:uncharacterized protein YjdB
MPICRTSDKNKGEKNMNNKLKIGLLLLVVALVSMPGGSAYPSKNNACTDCHSLSSTLSINTDISSITVAPGQSFDVIITYSGGNPSGATAVKWPSVNSNDIFTPTPQMPVNGNSPSKTTSSTLTAPSSPGIYTVTVYVATINPGKITNFKDITVTVQAPAPTPVLTTITVTPSSANLLVGRIQKFTAAARDQNGNVITPVISWTSSNETVGTIDASGNFSALAAGTTTIKAANGTVNGTASVTVTSPAQTPVLTTIKVIPPKAKIIIGKTRLFMAKTLDQFNHKISSLVTWASSNTSVGTIDSNGKFTALSMGTTTITATNGTINGSATITVKAKSSKHGDDESKHKKDKHKENKNDKHELEEELDED